MRIILTFLILPLIISCKSFTESTKNISENQSQNHCPEDGVCKMEILRNVHLNIKTDEIGATYPVLENGKSIVLKYEYIRNEIPNTADGGYRELIYFQLNPEDLEVNLKDTDLADVNLLYGRLCFCKGQTGYYQITNGTLSIKKIDDNTYNLVLNFKSTAVPQVITQITETFQI